MKEEVRAEGSICVAIDKYENKADFEARVSNTLLMLVKNGYQVKCREEETNIIVFDFCYGEEEFGAPRFMLVSAEEEDAVLSQRDWDEKDNEEDNEE